MPNKTKWFCNIYFILFLMCGRPHIWKKTRIKRNFATAFYFFILFHDRRPDGVAAFSGVYDNLTTVF